ncbi:MAG: hypothetical protein J1F35_05200 [Erysipelotrichales bacterium]|nr:hypothetical protein [Erysipelotrichales bacterium]
MKNKKFIYFIFLFLIILIPGNVFADKIEITGNDVRVRTEPKTGESNIIVTAGHGDTFDLVSTALVADKGGCSAGWYNVKASGKNGYVCSSYARIIETTVVVDPAAQSACEQELSKAGFPKQYWSGLCSLKLAHPNWTFNPINTGLDFKVAVEKESACKKNTISTSNQEYIDTSCTGSFDSGYKAVSQKAVAYYLNPTNFFDEKNIFMFESNYVNKNVSDDLYASTSKSILGTFMVDNLPSLTTAINNACRTKEVNQVMISSRIRQEIGTGKATSNTYAGQLLSCISGNYTTRWGTVDPQDNLSMDYYYNFFNVGVNDGSNGDAAYKSVLYAKRHGWGGTGDQAKDLELAIGGGVDFLKNKYITVGQDTIYFQKFNTHPVNSSNLYVNQYMSNIAAPVSEASIAYNAYKFANMLNSPFIFNIPVYNNVDVVIENSPNGAVPDGSTNSSNGLSTETIIVSSGYKLSGTTITGIAVGSTLNDINNKLKANGASITSGSLNKTAGTGMVIKISNGSTEKEYTLVVKGDTSGDGVINALDLLQVQKSILGSYKFNSAQMSAGDPSGDGKLDALDLLQIQKHILGSYKITQ